MNELKIAVWKDRITDMLSDVLAKPRPGGTDTSVSSVSAREAYDQLLRGTVDVAVLPSNLVLVQETALEVIPGVAISSKTHPFATIHLPDGMSCTRARVPSGPFPGLYSLISAIILQEGYGFTVFRDQVGEAEISLEGSGEKTQIVELTIGETSEGDKDCLDLGREWFELVSYPMVWALFVTRKGEGTENLNTMVRALVVEVEKERESGLDSIAISEPSGEPSIVGFRYRLDDLATASLTELCEFLYYYGETSDIPTLSVTSD